MVRFRSVRVPGSATASAGPMRGQRFSRYARDQQSIRGVIVWVAWVDPPDRETCRNGGAAGRPRHSTGAQPGLTTLGGCPTRPRIISEWLVVPVGDRRWVPATTSGRVREPFRSADRLPPFHTIQMITQYSAPCHALPREWLSSPRPTPP